MITDIDGTKTIMRDGQIHRKDGPAIEYPNGDNYWYLNGYMHREDGPAYENKECGYKQWYLNGIQYTEENHKRKLAGDELIPSMSNWTGGSGIGGAPYYYTATNTNASGYWNMSTPSIYVGATTNQTNAYIGQYNAGEYYIPKK
jgi:hypothetical protein